MGRNPVIEAGGLRDWLQNELGRPDLSALLQRLLEDTTLNNDLRLLEFCRALWPDLPAFWRGLSLSAINLYNTACAAERRESGSLEWLQSLLDGRCFDFYARSGCTGIENLGNRFRESLDQFGRGWNEIIEAGAPAEMRQSAQETLPTVIATAFSEQRRTALRRELLPCMDFVAVLLCEEWFLHFGTDLSVLSGPQLLILRRLARRAFANERVFESIDRSGVIDWRNPGAGVIIPEALQALLPGLNLVLWPGVIPFEIRPGEIHRPRRGRLREWLGTIARRIGVALARRRRPESATSEPSDLPEITATARLVRVTAGRPVQPLGVRDEYYFALVTWRAPENSPVRLEFDHPSWFLRTPGLRIGPLPPAGRILLLLTADTDLRVAAGRWPFRSIRMQAIGIRFEPKEKLLPPRHDLLKPRKTRLDPEGELKLPARTITPLGTLIQLEKTVFRTTGEIRRYSPDEVTPPRDTRMSTRRRTRREEQFANPAATDI